MMRHFACIVALVGWTFLQDASAVEMGIRSKQRGALAANPVRKVVNLLQSMQQKVTEEGEKEKALYEKFLCYCKTGGTDLSGSISAAKAKLGELATDIATAKSKHAKTTAELSRLVSDGRQSDDEQVLSAFLAGRGSYAPQSG